MALLDNILGQGSQTEGLASILSQKSGYAVQESGPKGSGILEKMQLAQAVEAGRQQAAKTALSDKDLQQTQAEQQGAVRRAKTETAAEFTARANQLDQQTKDLLQGVRQSDEQLAVRKDGAKLEQAAFNIRLQTDGYVQQLNQTAAMERLDQANVWEQKFYDIMYGQKTKDLQDAIGFSQEMAGNERAWKEKMNDLSIEDKEKLLDSMIADYKTSSKIEGGFGIAKAGIQAYGQGAFDSAEPKYTQEALTAPTTTESAAKEGWGWGAGVSSKVNSNR